MDVNGKKKRSFQGEIPVIVRRCYDPSVQSEPF
jgi:hypothetical protein